jgi:adenylate cyclase
MSNGEQPTLIVKVFNQGRLVGEVQVEGPLVIGRQNERETSEPLYVPRRKADHTRLLIADINEVNVSRTHLMLEPLADGRVRLTNHSRGLLHLDSGTLEMNAAREVVLPLTLPIGDRRLQLQAADEEVSSIVSLAGASLNISRDLDLARSLASTALSRAAAGTLDQEMLLQWVQAILGVLQGAAGTLEFLPRAARVVVDLIGLDSGRVLVRDNGGWQVRALQTAGGVAVNDEWRPSRDILARVLRDKSTCFLNPAGMANPALSLKEVTAVVAAPILDHAGDVSGILYGERRSGPLARAGIGRLEALLVEMLACALAVGLARLEQEERALRAQGQMEMYFTKKLAQHLAEHPEALAGRDVEVTLLSCDIRGFSRICERLKPQPAQTLSWLNDVLGVLSDCVLNEDGVLVDYVGDELMNLWGAPEAQSDHAARACRAALAMLAQVPLLNRRWQETVQEPMGVRVGVSSGPARVGNVGSARKFKYGALGSTTNLASRVQGAAKFFNVPLLITEATRRQLGDGFATRKLAQVQVVNIAEPVTLYELAPLGQPGWDELRSGYEAALACFEASDCREATRILGDLLTQPLSRDDGPSLVLLQRAVTALIEKAEDFSPVWELPSK